jgi:dTDP-glucose pyrophosphorylase
VAVVGVVPAAGHATRLGRIDTSKEMIEVGGRPLLAVLLERLEAAPCAEIRVVTRPQKHDVIAYAEARGATVICAETDTVARSLWLGLADLSDDDIVCFGFPDCLWEPADGFTRLVAVVGAGEEIALGLFRTNEPESYDPVVLADPSRLSGRVVRVEVKPRRAPSNLTWGCAAARVRALRSLEHERDPGEYFDARSRDGVVVGRWLSDVWIDLGTPARLAAALAAGGVPAAAVYRSD